MFDTLKYSKILEATGVPRDQAEAHIKIVAEIVEGELATKQDIQDTRQQIKQEIKDLRDEVTKLEYRLIIKMGAIVTAVVAVAVTLLKIQ